MTSLVKSKKTNKRNRQKKTPELTNIKNRLVVDRGKGPGGMGER